MYQGFSIHGNEPSGANAGLAAAYYLAAAQGSKIDDLLNNALFCLILLLILMDCNVLHIGQIRTKLRTSIQIRMIENITKFGQEEEPIIIGLI